MVFTSIIDVAVHQDRIDFDVMRSRGVQGLILRATHGDSLDGRVVEHFNGALSAGYADNDIGFYTFINPKRGSATHCATATIQAIRNIVGHTRTFCMLDLEDYHNEKPDVGKAPVFGKEYAVYVREFAARLRELAPDVNIIAYSNAGFWSGQVPGQPSGVRWVNDAQLAREFDFIVPRYHLAPPAALQKDTRALTAAEAAQLKQWQIDHAPPAQSDWADWAFKVSTKRPQGPNGVPFAGWQFSALYNGQAIHYGVAGDPTAKRLQDLDLNIVLSESWRRWTHQAGVPGVPSPPLAPAPDVLFRGEGLAPGEQRISKSGSTTLVHQLDGNVVVRKSNRTLFATGTAGRGSVSLIMQDDGNLVLYAHDGVALFHTRTQGNPGASLRVEDDGRIVIYTAALRPLFASDTIPDDGGELPAERRTAIVRAGDGFIRLATRELGNASRWREIARLNGGETRVLHPGDIVVLPD